MFLYSKWISLPINTRHLIAKEFGIPKKGSTHVQNNKIVSDGYDIKDIEEKLNVDAIQAYLEVPADVTDMKVLFDELVFRIENPNEGIIAVSEYIQATTEVTQEEVKEEIKEEMCKNGVCPLSIDSGEKSEISVVDTKDEDIIEDKYINLHINVDEELNDEEKLRQVASIEILEKIIQHMETSKE
jgi:hypothetical protein